MAKTINLAQLNGDWVVNNATGTDRIWTKGKYEIYYVSSIFDTIDSGWMVREKDGLDIFAFKTTGDPWSDDAIIVWNPNAVSTDNGQLLTQLNVKKVANKYLITNAGDILYNGLYETNDSLNLFNDNTVYVNTKNNNKYLFYSSRKLKWVLCDTIVQQDSYVYYGDLDGQWYSTDSSTPPTVQKYFPYMNVTQDNVKSGVYVQDIEGTFTDDATAVSEDILLGKSAYSNGIKYNGSLVVSNKQILFRIPYVGKNEYYHLYIQFSTTDSFDDVITYNTKDHRDLFRVFTGLAVSELQSSGLNYIFSQQSLEMNVQSISSSYKYFRFHWTNDYGANFGAYDFGNRDSQVQMYGDYVPVILGEIDQNGDFKPLTFVGNVASYSGETIETETYYKWNSPSNN